MTNDLNSIFYDSNVMKEVFGDNFCGPNVLEHFKETLVARFPSEDEYEVIEVYCLATPARFYIIKINENIINKTEPTKNFEIRTGSGCDKLVRDIANAFSRGMLTIDVVIKNNSELVKRYCFHCLHRRTKETHNFVSPGLIFESHCSIQGLKKCEDINLFGLCSFYKEKTSDDRD